MRIAPLLLLGVALLPRVATAQAWPPTYDVPRIDRVKVDGDASDWKDAGFRIEVLAPVDGRIVSTKDFDSLVRIGWTKGALLVTVAVADDVALEGEDGDGLTRGDSVEIFLTKKGQPAVRFVIAPGADPKHPAARKMANVPPGFFDAAGAAVVELPTSAFTAAGRKTAAGYVVEASIPLAQSITEDRTDAGVGLQIIVNDSDRPGHVARHMWYPADDTRTDPGHAYRLKLTDEPGPPVTVAVAGRYENAGSRVVVISNARADVGKRVELSEGPSLRDAKPGDRLPLAMGQIDRVADRYGVTLTTPVPPLGKPHGLLNVYVDSQQVVQVLPFGQEASRMSALSQLEVVFRPFVFTGGDFPRCEFADPIKALELIGERYVLKPAFFNAAHERVDRPYEPGRYGAVVDIESDGGKRLGRRLLTIFRQADSGRWTEEDLKVEVAPAARAGGIDPRVAREQQATLSGMLKDHLVDTFANEPDAALLMAALAETKPGDAPLAGRNSIWAKDQRWWFGLKKRLGLEKYQYAVDAPPHSTVAGSLTKEFRYPLLVFLHGSGERGGDLAQVRAHGPPRLMNDKEAFAAAFPKHNSPGTYDLSDFVVVSPQCPAGEWWSAAQLAIVIDEVRARYRIDPDRIYVTGLSMGGYGAWELAAEYPERFAAIVPICGAGSPADAERLKELPAWVFHGEKDRAVPFKRSVEMVEALKKAGAPVRFTPYPDAGHDSWTRTYANPELYEWLLKQKRVQPAAK